MTEKTSENSLANMVKTKIFLGCPITAELRLHLNQSPLWKQAQLERPEDRLQIIRYQEKEYLGQFIDAELPPRAEVEALAAAFMKTLEAFCPEMPLGAVHPMVFPQIFVS